jgi:cation transport regulator ChaB
MLGQRLDNEDQFRGRYKLLFGEDYNEFYDEVIKNWREQVRLGISQASEERAIRDQAIQEEELTQKKRLWDLNVESKEQAIAKEKKDVEKRRSDFLSKSIAENYASIAVREIEDYKKDHDGQIPHSVREKIISDNGVDVVRGRGDEDEYESRIQAIYGTRDSRTGAETKREKLAVDEATQYVVDMTIRGVESGMSIEGAYNNAVSAVRSGAVAGKFNDVEAVRRLKARGHDVMPPATEWVFDLDEQKPVKISERKRRQNPDKYGPPLSSVNGKLSEDYFNAGMAMLVADQAAIANGNPVENPMTLDLLVFYNTNGLVKLRKEDVAVMGRWSAAAQALKSASAPSTMSQMEALRLQIKQQQGAATEEEDDLQSGTGNRNP